MGRLLKAGGHTWFRDTYLFPTVQRRLAELLETTEPDGVVRADLMAWLELVNLQLSAALVGFDPAGTLEGATTLQAILMRMKSVKKPSYLQFTQGFDPASDPDSDGLRARQELVDGYFEPSLSRRVSLANKVSSGELTEAALPRDFLMLIALRADPTLDDRALATREAIFLLTAGSHTSALGAVFTLDNLFAWFDDRPDDYRSRFDDDFLLSAVNEALRLHPVTGGHIRRATEDMVLSKGTHIRKGDYVIIRLGPANLDKALFGDDAAQFNPHRTKPRGALPFGLAFGAGPHMCYGLPLVMGQEGIDGSIVHILKELFRAGVRPDPVRQTDHLYDHPGQFTEYLREYYVELTRESSTSPGEKPATVGRTFP
jgi:cytochrome P450